MIRIIDGDGDELNVTEGRNGAEIDITQNTQGGVMATVVLNRAQCHELGSELLRISDAS